MRRTGAWGAGALALLLACAARGATVQELVRIKGQGDTVLQGFGLVVGLPGTGDSGKSLLVARPLAKLLENQGLAVSFEELADSKSIALVEVTSRVPAEGGRTDDRFDVSVSAINNPKSLEGGRLFLTPLRGPYAGHGVYAVAEGPLEMQGANRAAGVVRSGARMVENIYTPSISPDGSLTLIIHPHVSGWTTSQLLATVINQHRVGFDESAPEIALALDDREVRVRIPDVERRDPANFIADMLGIRFDPSLLSLPARVVINEREGVIVVTEDVEISPTIVAYRDMMITTVSAPPPPRPGDEEVGRWASVATGGGESPPARLRDLLAAFKQLDVPVADQIAILMELHKTGSLHAELVID